MRLLPWLTIPIFIAAAFVPSINLKAQVTPLPTYQYLTHFEYVVDREGDDAWWCPGQDCTSVIDFRSLPEQAVPGGSPSGWAWVTYEGPRDICLVGCDYVGTIIGLGDAPAIGLTTRNEIRQMLGTGPLRGTNTRQVLAELLLEHGDPTGLTAWKPARGSYETGTVLKQGRQTIYSGPFNRHTRSWANTIAVFQADYRRHVAAGVPLDALQRWTGRTRVRLKLSDLEVSTLLLPPERSSDGFLDPGTIHADTANRGDNDDLNASSTGKTTDGSPATWTWTEVNNDTDIESNEFVARDNNDVDVRANADLSDDAMYTQAELTSQASSANDFGVNTRYDSSAQTYYHCRQEIDSGAEQVKKRISGTFTTLVNDTGTGPSLPATIKCESSANDVHSLYVDDILLTSTSTDTSITGNLRGGVRFNSTSGDGTWDNFETGDIEQAQAPSTVPAYGLVRLVRYLSGAFDD